MTTSILRQRTLAALGALAISGATFSAFAFSDDQVKTAARLAYTTAHESAEAWQSQLQVERSRLAFGKGAGAGNAS